MQDEGNRSVIGKDENAVRQLISMITSDNRHVVCWFLFSAITRKKVQILSFGNNHHNYRFIG